MDYLIPYSKNWYKWVRYDPRNLPHQVITCLRFYSEWMKTIKNERNSFLDNIPWITYDAYYFLESMLKPGMVVFEYGSGGSTFFYANKVEELISIDHDEGWFIAVEAKINELGVSNCKYNLIKPELNHQSDGFLNHNVLYSSYDTQYKDYNFESYVRSIELFPDQYFDLVAVDGRARNSCIRHAISKVKINGYLMLDNSERDRYKEAKYLLRDWEKMAYFGPGPYNGYFWETTFWRRIST